MVRAFFDLFFEAANFAWSALGTLLGFGWKLLTAVLDLFWRLVGAAGNLLFEPFRWLDRIWDGWHGGWDLGSVFLAVLAVLLISCAVLAAVAFGENLYRRWRSKEEVRLSWPLKRKS